MVALLGHGSCSNLILKDLKNLFVLRFSLSLFFSLRLFASVSRCLNLGSARFQSSVFERSLKTSICHLDCAPRQIAGFVAEAAPVLKAGAVVPKAKSVWQDLLSISATGESFPKTRINKGSSSKK